MFFPTSRETELRLVRGASHTLEVSVWDADGEAYVLQQGEVIRFGVKYDTDSKSCLIKKEVTSMVDGVCRIEIAPEDTRDMETGVYKFDIGLQSGTSYFTVVKYSDLILEPNVTERE